MLVREASLRSQPQPRANNHKHSRQAESEEIRHPPGRHSRCRLTGALSKSRIQSGPPQFGGAAAWTAIPGGFCPLYGKQACTRPTTGNHVAFCEKQGHRVCKDANELLPCPIERCHGAQFARAQLTTNNCCTGSYVQSGGFP